MTSVAEQRQDHTAQQRLLEGWLPLAQEANLRYGWGLDAAGLEALILGAAPPLQHVRSTFEAYAILWSSYGHAQRKRISP